MAITPQEKGIAKWQDITNLERHVPMKNALTAGLRTLSETLTGRSGATDAALIRHPVIASLEMTKCGRARETYRVQDQHFSTFAKARTYSRTLFAHENHKPVEDWI